MSASLAFHQTESSNRYKDESTNGCGANGRHSSPPRTSVLAARSSLIPHRSCFLWIHSAPVHKSSRVPAGADLLPLFSDAFALKAFLLFSFYGCTHGTAYFGCPQGLIPVLLWLPISTLVELLSLPCCRPVSNVLLPFCYSAAAPTDWRLPRCQENFFFIVLLDKSSWSFSAVSFNLLIFILFTFVLTSRLPFLFVV